MVRCPHPLTHTGENVCVQSIFNYRQAAQGSQTGSQGLQAGVHAVASLECRFAKNPPNGRNGAAQPAPHGSHGSGSQATCSQGLQQGVQTDVRRVFMFAKNPPNGRHGRTPQDEPHGSQMGSQGLQAIGSHGWHATCSQGLQPFQTTESRPKMPASATVVAANSTIAVNMDTTSFCFILILLKIRLGKSVGNDCHSFVA